MVWMVVPCQARYMPVDSSMLLLTTETGLICLHTPLQLAAAKVIVTRSTTTRAHHIYTMAMEVGLAHVRNFIIGSASSRTSVCSSLVL